jgi:hypothetical protein
VSKQYWSRRSRLLTACGSLLVAIGLVWITFWLLTKTDGNDGAGIANVLAFPVSAIGTALAILGLRSRPYRYSADILATHARSLILAVATTEARTLAQLLGDTGDPRPADISFEQQHAALVTWRTDRGAQVGSLETIHPYYTTLDRGRLVVLGDAGSGKTVLAIRLLLDIAAHAINTSSRIIVPVRLSLPTFISKSTRTTEVRRDFEEWIIGHLFEVHGVPRDISARMLAEGWILPILDGLDEMDREQADTLERAQGILKALNLPVGTAPMPVVLTCRASHFEDLTAPTVESPQPLQDATVIVLQPLSVSQVVAWLSHRFPDATQPNNLQRRWRRVASTLRDRPTGRLASCLTSPLHLYLAVTVYRSPNSFPAEMCDLDARTLSQHLFAQLVPAVTASLEDTPYDSKRAELWLRTLANHLARIHR